MDKHAIARRMEVIREQLDEDGDLSPAERQVLRQEYRSLSNRLVPPAASAPQTREE